jgi:tripartite-type tricarboxylate transporter receptor subunit TctC
MALVHHCRRFCCALALLVPLAAFAQAWPDKPIRMLVGFSPGGFTDVLARLVGQKLHERLGQPVVIENKPGAAGTIAADQVAKSKPDGYTLLMGHSNSNSIAPALYPKLPYDIHKDFTPIVLVASTPFTLSVHPSVQATDVRALSPGRRRIRCASRRQATAAASISRPSSSCSRPASR